MPTRPGRLPARSTIMSKRRRSRHRETVKSRIRLRLIGNRYELQPELQPREYFGRFFQRGYRQRGQQVRQADGLSIAVHRLQIRRSDTLLPGKIDRLAKAGLRRQQHGAATVGPQPVVQRIPQHLAKDRRVRLGAQDGISSGERRDPRILCQPRLPGEPELRCGNGLPSLFRKTCERPVARRGRLIGGGDQENRRGGTISTIPRGPSGAPG